MRPNDEEFQIFNAAAPRRSEGGSSKAGTMLNQLRRVVSSLHTLCGASEKIKSAMRLRQESAMSLKWIAEQLRMGAWTHVSNLLVQQRKNRAECK
jgi:hypothetical protein